MTIHNKDESDFREWSNDSYRYPSARRGRHVLVSLFIAIVAIYLLFFLPLPYFIFMPGTAEEIKPMVKIGQGTPVEKGTLMLTTVAVQGTNIANYVVALFHPYEELQPKKDLFRNGESEKEYSQRQEYVMLTSQSSAMEAAYQKASVPYHIHNEGVMVLQTLPNMPAAKVLQAGDYILKMNDTPIVRSSDLLNFIKGKKAGDSIQVTYKRNQAEKIIPLSLAVLPKDPQDAGKGSSEERSGLGIVPADVQSVKADQEAKQITIKAGEIGGPSAGLMFSLEIYNQLTPDDITKGYRIAGTGTIDDKGNVGVIGGIKHKIIAADKAGAEIFFAPKDYVATTGQKVNNYSDAVSRAKQIHSKMKIVPVETMDDALKYLASLPPHA